MSDITLVVGKRLRACRIKKGLSQEKLAETAGFHPTYVGQVERGEKNLTIESLEKMCRALEISFSKLFEGIMPDPTKQDIPLKCYEIVNEMDCDTQKHTLRILEELHYMKKIR